MSSVTAPRTPRDPTSSPSPSMSAASASGDERLVSPDADIDERAVEAALRPRTLDEFIGQHRVRAQLGLDARGGAATRAHSRPRAAERPTRPRQDHAGDDHRGRDAAARCASPAARRSSTPETWRRSCPAWPRARCSSSTRSIACPGRRKRCSTWRWRTSGSTSSSARDPGPPRSRWRSRRSRWWAPTTRAGLLPGPLRDRFGFTGPHGLLRRRGARAGAACARRSCSTCRCTTPAPRRSPARSRGTPRIANRLLRRVRDYAQVKADGTVTLEIARGRPGGLRGRRDRASTGSTPPC